ncbi:MAG: 4Fe-4S dicluster domain-containing protein, partial [Gammaproteobacteria bacterium]|nr:4Fe-4S dicluster domain-containing protein [Gammaproteobacteria bacterium]
ASHAEFLEELTRLGQTARADQKLAARIRKKFKIKNTTGYSLNALVDFEDPIDILQHLMIGSEGTLAFMAEITYNTVIEHQNKASALVFFPDIRTACEAVAILKDKPVAAVELMDRTGIRSVENKPGMPGNLRELPDTGAALLIETRAQDASVLGANIERVEKALAAVETVFPFHFSDRVEEYTKYWQIRKGMFPSVGAMREAGTTVIIEDIAFPVPRLADGTLDLQALFKKHGYHNAIIFGHALEGNLHFVITPDFADSNEISRYQAFMDELCHMVVEKYDGSLKAEHGTGRNIAPFTELEWGKEAYALMLRIKTLFDPEGILNPGVILNEDALIHIKNLKPLPKADPIIDQCIECGFCEPFCPSRSVSLTPRQRIVGMREMARLEAAGDAQGAKVLRRAYQYQGIDTCAGDSLCSIACPVDIDTGHMMKTLRGRRAGRVKQVVGNWVADHYGAVSRVTRRSLAAADLMHGALGTRAMSALALGLRRLSRGRIPLWTPAMPRPAHWQAPRINPVIGEAPRVVYFPSCATRMMGPARGDDQPDSLITKTETLLRKSGFEVVFPDRCDDLCCGMPFESKGLMDQAQRKLDELEARLSAASRGGQDAIVFDTSPCAFRTKRYSRLKVYDITEFIHDVALDRLNVNKQPETVAVHATCSTVKMGLDEKLTRIAEACAQRVVVPDGVTCCGWAGDKGWTTPELNAGATRLLKPGLPQDCRIGYSTSRTCEIGLSFHSGRPYRSIVYLVDRCSTPRADLSTG